MEDSPIQKTLTDVTPKRDLRGAWTPNPLASLMRAAAAQHSSIVLVLVVVDLNIGSNSTTTRLYLASFLMDKVTAVADELKGYLTMTLLSPRWCEDEGFLGMTKAQKSWAFHFVHNIIRRFDLNTIPDKDISHGYTFKPDRDSLEMRESVSHDWMIHSSKTQNSKRTNIDHGTNCENK
jgi:hypothetical protein